MVEDLLSRDVIGTMSLEGAIIAHISNVPIDATSVLVRIPYVEKFETGFVLSWTGWIVVGNKPHCDLPML